MGQATSQLSEAVVGSWVRRHKSRPWHKAQSVFLGEVLTKCGKFMASVDVKKHRLEARMPSAAGVTVKPSDMCQNCFHG